MFDNPKFAKLVSEGRATGEVIGVDRFLVTVQGLGDVAVNALIYFDNGHQGLVREVRAETVMVLNLSAESIIIGTLAVVEAEELVTGVGDAVVGRVLSVTGQPLDGKGPLTFSRYDPVFKVAPGIVERKALDQPLTTGVAIADQLFPLVKGQRIAVLGDNKVGKSAFTMQMTLAQAGTGRIVIHVLISKRKADVDKLIAKLTETKAIDYCVIIVASIFDSLAQSYLAPYIGASIAEYLWNSGKDCIIIYDDLSNHAKAYRELSLLLKVSPGRASYPGDMFYAHSSLLERAGRLATNGATLAAIPVVLTPNNDITAPLPTAIMSITDGQLIFDSEAFRAGIRPAVSVGLSVSRVGGVGQDKRQKKLTASLFKKLAAYRQAAEFSHFGSELAIESRADLELGKKIYEALKQPPDVIYSANVQDLILGTVMKTEGKIAINIDSLKRKAAEIAPTMKPDSDWEGVIAKLLAEVTVQAAPPPGTAAKPPGPPGSAPAAGATPPAAPAKPEEAKK
ncbi:MAG TPA: sodium-transporting two-sector ATPase [Candidatus Saccharimonadia bacterium]|nr:sodium-transporting two-sector ATPase [Candidatus Saccharimonadia bacterium]